MSDGGGHFRRIVNFIWNIFFFYFVSRKVYEWEVVAGGARSIHWLTEHGSYVPVVCYLLYFGDVINHGHNLCVSS